MTHSTRNVLRNGPLCHAARAGLLLACIAGFGLTAAAQENAAHKLVLRDVTVVDVDTGKVSPKSTVIIAGGRIERVGSTSREQIPTGAKVIDA